jgi:hypothetical protein
VIVESWQTNPHLRGAVFHRVASVPKYLTLKNFGTFGSSLANLDGRLGRAYFSFAA